MRAFVSVDWDYFIRSLYSWDWGHQESPMFMQGWMWATRAASLMANGLDIEAEMDPARWANPKPASFWNILSQLGYDFYPLDSMVIESGGVGVQNFVIADSHAMAGPAFREIAEDIGVPDIIINFDAHHDMGYGNKAAIRRQIAKGTVTCDMWLLSLMSMYREMRANVVFPNWRLEEFSMQDEWESMKKVISPQVQRRTKIGAFIGEDGTVSDVVKPDSRIEVQALFICRSSAWAPPWLDGQFVDFIDGIQDHVSFPPFECVSEQMPDIKPLEVRKDFSMDQARAMAEQWRTFMAMKKPDE